VLELALAKKMIEVVLAIIVQGTISLKLSMDDWVLF
jgi:hypothetical protein